MTSFGVHFSRPIWFTTTIMAEKSEDTSDKRHNNSDFSELWALSKQQNCENGCSDNSGVCEAAHGGVEPRR